MNFVMKRWLIKTIKDERTAKHIMQTHIDLVRKF